MSCFIKPDEVFNYFNNAVCPARAKSATFVLYWSYFKVNIRGTLSELYVLLF